MPNRKKSNKNWFSQTTLRAAMAESPALMQASGWEYDKDGNLHQNPNSEGARKLSESLGVLSAIPMTVMSGGLANGALAGTGALWKNALKQMAVSVPTFEAINLSPTVIGMPSFVEQGGRFAMDYTPISRISPSLARIGGEFLVSLPIGGAGDYMARSAVSRIASTSRSIQNALRDKFYLGDDALGLSDSFGEPEMKFSAHSGLSSDIGPQIKIQDPAAPIANETNYGNIRFIRNLSGVPDGSTDAGITLAPQKNIFGNFTTDLPFRLHPQYSSMPGGEVLVIEPEALRGKTPWNIDPMDTFFRANELTGIDPKYITMISGNENVLRQAEKLGMSTRTSQDLIDAYRNVENDLAKLRGGQPQIVGRINLGKSYSGWGGSSVGMLQDYRKAMDAAVSEIGRPTYEDYKTLESVVNLPSGVSRDVEYGRNELMSAIRELEPGVSSNRQVDSWISFPDRRLFDFYKTRKLKPYLLMDAPDYRNVYYNPYPSSEDDLLRMIGGHGHQEYVPSYDGPLQDLFSTYVNSSPLKRRGGLLDRLNKHYNGDRSKIIQAMQYARGGFKRDDVSKFGHKFFDIVRLRYLAAKQALENNGTFTKEEIDRLVPIMVLQNATEADWRLDVPGNNIGGMMTTNADGSQTRKKYDSLGDYYLEWLDMMDKKFGDERFGSGKGWRSAKDADDYARIINLEDQDVTTKAKWNAYKKTHPNSYLYAPQWDNGDKTYSQKMAERKARTDAYLKMVMAELGDTTTTGAIINSGLVDVLPISGKKTVTAEPVAPQAPAPQQSSRPLGLFRSLIPTSVQQKMPATQSAPAQQQAPLLHSLIPTSVQKKMNNKADGGLIERYGVDKVRAAMQKVKR